MATAARIREAERASAAFHDALTALGVQATLDALMLWEDVPAQVGVPGWAAWLPRTIRYALLRRAQARALAKAYYRLNRALLTGNTVALPGETPGQQVPLNGLRSDFSDLVGYDYRTDAPEAAEPVAEPDPVEDAQQDAAAAQDELDEVDDVPDPDEQIILEEIARLDEEDAEREREAEEELQIILDALGRDDLENKLADVAKQEELAAREARELEAEAHRQAGAKQAAAVGRVVQNGARSSIFASTRRDPRCIGYVRVSKTGTPCGWCAMLISRGLQYAYSTEARGTFKKSSESVSYEDGDRYHDNCYCYAMPIFSAEQYNESDVFQLNREYSEAWPEVTAGLSGKAAVKAWRRYIRNKQRAAQAAAA